MPKREPQLPPKSKARGLRPTDLPGVYRNRHGEQVDEYGVLLSFKELQKRDAQRFAEVVEDPSIQSPAELLRAIALDPRHPLLMRMEAAVKAAPYFDKKKPLAIETAPAAPTPLNEETLKNMSPDELLQLLALLKKAKVAVG